MENEQFKQDLDELFRLFNLLMEKQSDELSDMPGVNKMMLQQFRLFFNNYENMKDQIAYQLQGQFGEPVREMVKTLIQQLREELGDEALQIDKQEDTEVPILHIQPNVNNPKDEIEKIDKMLKTPNLTPEQIDELLDRRSQLQP